MKFSLMFSLVGVFFFNHSFAQLPTKESITDLYEKVKTDYETFLTNAYDNDCNADKDVRKQEKTRIVSYDAFKKLSEKYFAYAITDKDNTAIGTFASLDFGSNDTKLNLSVSSRVSSRSYLTFSTSLGIKDKTGSIFTNNKINSGFSGSIKYSIRSSNTKVYYYKAKCEEFKKTLAFQKELSLSLLNRDYAKNIAAINRINQINAEHANCNSFLSLTGIKDSSPEIKACSDLLDEKIKLEQTFTAFNKLTTAKLLSSYKDSLISFEAENASINGISFFWWSFIAGYGSESYDLYDKTRVKPEASIFTKSHNRFKLGIEFNHFINLTETYTGKALLGRSRYFTFGLNWENDNNIKSLKALKTPFTFLTVNNDTVNTTAASEKNILYDASATAFSQYGSLKANLRYLTYYTKNKTWGIDVFGDASINENYSGPLLNAGVGIVFNLKNKEDSKPKVSFEVFYKFVDLTERLPNSNGIVVERNEIGITAAIPFQKFIL